MVATAQLSFLDEDTNPPSAEMNLVDSLLFADRGDYRKVINELLLDGEFLRDQLATASQLMSSGIGRGWRPKYERT